MNIIIVIILDVSCLVDPRADFEGTEVCCETKRERKVKEKGRREKGPLRASGVTWVVIRYHFLNKQQLQRLRLPV